MSCSFAHQLECDESRSPSVVVTVRCFPAILLNQDDFKCESVFTTVLVKHWNSDSVTGQLGDVSKNFSVACKSTTIDQLNPPPTDYDVVL